MGKILEFRKLDHNSEEYVRLLERGLEVLSQIQDDDSMAIVSLLIQSVMDEVEAGVTGQEIGPLFEMIDGIYRKAKDSKCYFCNEDVDPNETEFTKKTHLCLFCLLKVANILTAAGLDPKKISGIAGNRRIQKTRL